MLRYLLVFLALGPVAVAPPARAQQPPQAVTRLAYQEPAAPLSAPIAPLADKECEGFDAKHCLRQEMTGCPFDLVEPGMGCRTIYSKDPDDITGLLGVVGCDENGCRGLDEIEAYRFKQGAILNNRRKQYGVPWVQSLADPTDDGMASGIDPEDLSPETNPPKYQVPPVVLIDPRKNDMRKWLDVPALAHTILPEEVGDEPSPKLEKPPTTDLEDWLTIPPVWTEAHETMPQAVTEWPQISTPMNPHKEPRPTMGVAQIPILSLLFR